MLDTAWREWRSWSWRRHVVALGVLLLALVPRFWTAVADPQPLEDEAAYLQAFARVAAGVTPYQVGSDEYWYPPAFAYAGALLFAGRDAAAMVALRAGNLLGLAALAWLSVAWLPFSWRGRLFAALGVALLSPAAALGIDFGNLSPGVAGLIVAALCLWPARPLLAGLALGASLAIKPLAPAAVVALASQRPTGGGRRHLVAAAVATLIGAFLWLSVPRLAEFLSWVGRPGLFSSTLSPHRLLALAGIAAHPLWVTAPVLLALVVVLRRERAKPPTVLALACAGCVMATPSVWSYTLVLTLPLQAMAVTIAIGRRAVARWWEPVLLGLAIGALHLGAGATWGIDDRAPWIQLGGVLPQLLAPPALAAYVLRWNERLVVSRPA
jgi:hypothetical protein